METCFRSTDLIFLKYEIDWSKTNIPRPFFVEDASLNQSQWQLYLRFFRKQ